MDICFKPNGQALVRFAVGPTEPFAPLTEVPDFHVYRTINVGATIPSGDESKSAGVGLVRHVLIPPVGPARLSL